MVLYQVALLHGLGQLATVTAVMPAICLRDARYLPTRCPGLTERVTPCVVC